MAKLSVLGICCFLWYMQSEGSKGVASLQTEILRGRQLRFNVSKNFRSQTCMNEDCSITMTPGESLVWPNTCRLTSHRNACTFNIVLSEQGNNIQIDFLPIKEIDELIAAGISEYYLESSVYLLYPSPETAFLSRQYMCETGVDGCEKKFLEDNIANLTRKIDVDSVRNKLSDLLYAPVSQVKQCYTNSSAL